MQRLLLHSIFLSYALLYPIHTLAQTNRPSVFPHGVVVSGTFSAVTAMVQSITVSNLQVISDATVTNLSAEKLQGQPIKNFVRWLWWDPNNNDFPGNPGTTDVMFTYSTYGVFIWVPQEQGWYRLDLGPRWDFPWEN